MKLERYLAIVCILGIACILTVGCEKVNKPMMDAVDMAMTDTATPTEMGDVKEPDMPAETDTPAETEPPLPTIDFKPEIEQPTLPEDFEPLPDDNVVHSTEITSRIQVRLNDAGELDINGNQHFYDPLIVDDAVSALENEAVINFFKWWELQIAERCKGGRFSNTGGIVIYFTHPNRGERDKLAEHLTKSLPSAWLVRSSSVYILNNETVYYPVSVRMDFGELDTFCE